ncbi:MAG: hypothetical protein ABFS45_03575 [Pseudomonadota bacterium]
MNLKEAREKYGIVRGRRHNYYQFYTVKPTYTRTYGVRDLYFYRYVKQGRSGVLERDVLKAADGWMKEYFHWNEILPVKEAADIAEELCKLSERYLVHEQYKDPVLITNQIAPFGRQTGYWIAQLGKREFRDMWEWLEVHAKKGVMLLGDKEMLAHDPELEAVYRNKLC